MKRVTIVGVGALGSHVFFALRNEVIFTVIDGDKVETKNVLSQYHGRTGVGRNKALALKSLAMLVHGHHVTAHPVMLTKDNTLTLVPEHLCDLLIDCADNAEARHRCQVTAMARDIPCLHAGLAADGAYGMVRWDDDFQIGDPPAGVPTCEDGLHLPFIVEVAARAAMAAQTYLRTGQKRGYAVAPDSVIRI